MIITILYLVLYHYIVNNYIKKKTKTKIFLFHKIEYTLLILVCYYFALGYFVLFYEFNISKTTLRHTTTYIYT